MSTRFSWSTRRAPTRIPIPSTAAIAKGDLRRVEEFYAGPSIAGIIREDPAG
ncbi:MAG: hypothetical protein HUU21_09210 [Polyangiaceae bacterium]|nr:hypothetical protein [Polyangiaceae bacterium]